MKKNKNAFTLVEMIVWVSITLVLMISVWIFVSSWMKNITIQKQILDKNNDIWNLVQDLDSIFWQNYNIITNTSTSILLKTNYILWNPAYYYIWEKTSTWYCLNDPDLENKYLVFKAFNPIFLTWTTYSWSYIQNVIYSGWQIIVWNWVFWDTFTNWSNWTWTYLNNPSSITFDWWWKLYISDSWNNRVLYVSGGLIYKLLDIDDGIFNPTWILYYLSKLYILNSWKNQLLVMDSSSSSSKPIALTISPEHNITIDKIDIEVLPNDFVINWTYDTWSYDFWWTITKNPWDTVSQTGNKLTYNFVWWSKSLIWWVNYPINIPSFSWNLSPWTYYLKVNLYDWTDMVYEKYFSYVVNWDDDLTTLNDNTLKILTWWLNSNFSEIKPSWSNILLNNYIDWEYLKLNEDWDFVGSWSITPFNINDFDSVDKSNNLMIKDLKVGIIWNLLTLKIDYYKIFSCFNPKDSLVKTILLKKIIPN